MCHPRSLGVDGSLVGARMATNARAHTHFQFSESKNSFCTSRASSTSTQNRKARGTTFFQSEPIPHAIQFSSYSAKKRTTTRSTYIMQSVLHTHIIVTGIYSTSLRPQTSLMVKYCTPAQTLSDGAGSTQRTNYDALNKPFISTKNDHKFNSPYDLKPP